MTRKMSPDLKKAESIVTAAEKDMNFTLDIEPSENSGSTIIRNIYESFRMLGDALLVAKGLKSTDHSEQIKELIKLNVKADRAVSVLENLKRIRQGINYHGYSPSNADVKDAINIAETLFEPLLKAVKEKLKE